MQVTDAPEVHSNGFHVKFDISEGQIGFVLPTIVLPCDIDLFSRLASSDTDHLDNQFWNTCIVLPFRSRFLDTLKKLWTEVIRRDVQTTEISMALTLQESIDGDYTPLLDQWPVFAFLPLRTYGLNFILQEILLRFSCFRENLGKAVSAFMSFVGEVHGFFSSLPRLIISKLRVTNCLLLERGDDRRAPPCKVLRGWNEQARILLPDKIDLIENLKKIPFIPLSDGTYSSVNEGNLTNWLHRIGVQWLSAHEIVKVHILPAVSDDGVTNRDKNLMIEYVCFVMIHLQSSCPDCHVEREFIISQLQNKAFILTNQGFQRLVEVPIHFSAEYGNPVNVNMLINVVDMKWHEVDTTYLRHPVT
nr:hypothetical protein CFP56_39544 [Quercus suber]